MGRTNRHADRHQDTHTLTHGEVIVVVATSATHMWARTCSLMLSHGQVCDQQLYSLSTKLTTKSQSILPMHYNKSQQVSQLSASTTKRHEHTFCNHLDIETFRGVRAPQPGIEWTSNGKHRSLHTQTLLHNNVFHTDTFTHRRLTQKGFYTQKLAHTEAFTHRSFYIHRILHTETFTHTHTLWHTELHTEAFTHRSFYRQKLSHTEAFTHKHFHTQRPNPWHRNFTQFLAIEPHFVQKGCARTREIAILPPCLAIEPHFERKGLPDALQIAILPQFLAIEPHFVRKGCDWTPEFAILPQFLAIESHFVRKGCDGNPEIAILPQLLAIEPHFVRKGCISWRRAFKREIEKKEGARGQERMWRCEDEKIWRCTDVEMWGCEDEKMGRYVKMRRCEDEKMWRWEDVSQTPTIRRTLRSDALGKKTSQICPNGIFDIFPWHFPWILSRGMFHRFSESMENAVENVGIFRFSQCWVFHSFPSISWNFR